MPARATTPWVLLLTLPFACAQDRPPETSDLRAHVEFLASDRLAGREAGEDGIVLAEDYIAAAFKRYGLKPLPGEDDFFVDFTLYRGGYDREKTTIVTGERSAAAGEDFRPFAFSDAGEIEANVVFAGYGITAPEHDWNDYQGLDVEGKLVLLLRHEPEERDPDSSFNGASHTDHARFDAKARNARAQGARGMILVTDPLHHNGEEDFRVESPLRLQPPTGNGSAASSPFLAVHVSRRLAQALLPDGESLADLQGAVDGGKRPARLGLKPKRATIRVTPLSRVEEVPARNVAGFLPGGDPRLADEWIVVGGHHDHIGAYAGRGDTIYNGADDNASGTAGVLELARAFAARAAAGQRPPRSLVFATFTAEEKGLLGSRAMVSQNQIPIDKTVFMVNFDMIGRNPDKEVRLMGDGYARGLSKLVEEANDGVGLDVSFSGRRYSGASDHDTFYRAGVPFLFFFTGMHEDYHRQSDHAELVAYDQMEEIVELGERVVSRLAEAPRTPSFIHRVDWLGLQVEVADEDGKRTARITAVEEESKATRLGFRRHDVLLALDGEAFDDPRQAGRRVREIEPGHRAVLAVARGDERLEIAVERAEPGFMGVVPRPLGDAERRELDLSGREGLVLASVLEDGPSERAGLRDGDVLIRIAGRWVSHGNLTGRLAQIGAGETVEVVVLRDGRQKTFSLTLGQRP